MGLACRDILRVQGPVEMDGSAEILHQEVGFGAESSAPHFVAHDRSLIRVAPKGSIPQQVLSTISDLPPEPYYKVRRRRLIAATAWALCGALAVLAGVYGIGRLRGNPGDTACQPAVQTAARLVPLVHGEVAALSLAHTGFLVPDLAFKDTAGRDRTLKDWRGRTVLLNLWATWCVPCRKEMPALDALEGKLGGQNFEVVAVNIDTRDPQKPLTFLKDVGIKRLG